MDDILRLVAKREILMSIKCARNSTGMLACQSSWTQIADLIQRRKDLSGLEIVCYNSSNSCVVGGSLTDLDAFAQQCALENQKTKLLDVPYAFHSQALEPIMKDLEEAVQHISFRSPSIKLISSVTGSVIGPKDLDETYLMQHSRRPVKFLEATQQLQASNDLTGAVFVEIGPHPITLPLIDTTLRLPSCEYLISVRKGRPSWDTLSDSLCKFSMLQSDIKWRAVFDGTGAKLVDLPGYPLNEVEYHVPFSEQEGRAKKEAEGKKQVESETPYRLVPVMLQSGSDDEKRTFQSELWLLADHISGHSVGGVPICPASVYHEMALEAAQSYAPLDDNHVFITKELCFLSPLTYVPERGLDQIQISLSKGKLHEIQFSIASVPQLEKPSTKYCSGILEVKSCTDVSQEWAIHAQRSKRLANAMFMREDHDITTFQPRVLYKQVFTRVVDYSEAYQSLLYLKMTSLGMDGYGDFKVPSSSLKSGFITSPYFTDTLLHTAGFIVNLNAASTEIYICSKVGTIKLLYNDISWEELFTVQCSLFASVMYENTICADSLAFDVTGRLVAMIENMEFKKMQIHNLRSHLQRNAGLLANITSLPVGFPKSGRQNSTPVHEIVSTTTSTAVNTPQSQDKLKETIISVIAKTCSLPTEHLEETKELSALGMDSLLRLELIDALALEFPNLVINRFAVQEAQTVQDLLALFLSIELISAASSLVVAPPQRPTTPQDTGKEDKVSSIRKKLLQILKTTCNLRDLVVVPEQTLDSLGVDSLMTIELAGMVSEDLGLGLDLKELQQCQNLGQLLQLGEQAYLSQSGKDQEEAASLRNDKLDEAHYARLLRLDNQPIQLQSSYSERAPLFLFHDGSGLCSVYYQIGNLDREVFGFSNPDFFNADRAPKKLQDMASRFVSAILAKKHSKVMLGGKLIGSTQFSTIYLKAKSGTRLVFWRGPRI